MKITEFDAGQMVQVSEKEALVIIQSLTNQLISDGDNMAGRAEHFTDQGKYFSIAIIEDEPTTIHGDASRDVQKFLEDNA